MNNNILFLISALTVILYLSFVSCSTINDPAQSINNVKLNEAFEQAKQIGNLKSLVVSHNGIVVKEAFYNEGGKDAAHDVRSVTKSVIAILIGIAIDKGIIPSVDQTMGIYINPIVQNLSTEKSNIKIRHLLTMSSAFEWDELTNVSGYNNWITSENQVQYLTDKSLVAVPGQTFTYNSAALHLLSVILTKAANMSTLNFAKQYLFEPLEIGERNWQVDKQGFYNGGAGLQITPYDMIKIGELILNRGEYKGKRIVSAQWIDEIAAPKIAINNSMSFATGYSYGWWTGESQKGKYIFAIGWGGQFIVLVPNLKLVVTATNKWSGVTSTTANEQWYRTMDLIVSKILTSVN